jgi:SSS family solute:Na+ symporter
VFGLLFAFFLAPKIRDLPHRSIPDHFKHHFGHSAGIVSAVLVLILASPAPYILSLGILLRHTIGWSLQSAILISTGLSLAYIWYGGFRSVVRTDILQFIFMFTGFILLLVFAWNLNDAPLSLKSSLPERYFDLTGGKSIQYIFVWFFIAMWTFIDPGFYQRTAAASSPRTAKKGILISIFFWFIFDILTVTTGLYAVALFPNQEAAMAYPELALRILPPFVYGIFLVGLFSTIMSTIDSNGLISAITFGRDILLRIQQKDEQGNETQYIRKGLIVMAIIAVLLALSIPSVVQLWYVIGSIIVPGILLPFLMTFTQTRLNNGKIIPAMILPVIVAIFWFLYGHFSGHYPMEIEPFYSGLFTSGVLVFINRPLHRT